MDKVKFYNLDKDELDALMSSVETLNRLIKRNDRKFYLKSVNAAIKSLKYYPGIIDIEDDLLGKKSFTTKDEWIDFLNDLYYDDSGEAIPYIMAD
ncbi:MAG: hypothetical protein LBL45_10055 [Treponema sp.]|jgi:hypothetical protein|nr:hypothetical protein [Treponema sp.]